MKRAVAADIKGEGAQHRWIRGQEVWTMVSVKSNWLRPPSSADHVAASVSVTVSYLVFTSLNVVSAMTLKQEVMRRCSIDSDTKLTSKACSR